MLTPEAKRGFLRLVGVLATTATLTAAALAVGAAPPASGAFTWNKTRLAMVDGYAHVKPDIDGKVTVLAVTLVGAKLDRSVIDGALDRDSAIDEQAAGAKAAVVQFIFGTDGKLLRMNAQVRGAGPVKAVSTAGLSFKSSLTTNTATRVAGRVRTDGPERFSDDAFVFDLTFDIPVTPEPPPGTPLPPAGGEAGKAYVALVAAVQKGDADAIARFWPKEKAAQMLASRHEPDFAENLALLKMFGPTSVTVKGGTIRGDVADLDVVGKNAKGHVMDGKVRMVKDGSSWRLLDEKLTTHMK